MSMITDVYAREILDSRGNPTPLKSTFIWKTAALAGPQCPPVLPPALLKP